MGLSIYYCGILYHPEDAENLITDAIDICHEIGWRYFPIHSADIMPVEGLFITPEGSESIELTFLASGRLYNALHFLYTHQPEKEEVDAEKHKWISTKTGYAGSDTHMAIIKFLRYISQKYFREFELKDESHYWETNDVDNCRFHFGETKEANEMMNKARGLMGHDPNEEVSEDEEEDDSESSSDEMEEILTKRGGYHFNLTSTQVSEIQRKENVDMQLTVSSAVLRQLHAMGMNEKESHQIEFFFYADLQDKANNLAIELTRLGCKVELSEPSAGMKSKFLVNGLTPEIKMDSISISNWTTLMCELGHKEDCVFDGWGTFSEQKD